MYSDINAIVFVRFICETTWSSSLKITLFTECGGTANFNNLLTSVETLKRERSTLPRLWICADSEGLMYQHHPELYSLRDPSLITHISGQM